MTTFNFLSFWVAFNLFNMYCQLHWATLPKLYIQALDSSIEFCLSVVNSCLWSLKKHPLPNHLSQPHFHPLRSGVLVLIAAIMGFSGTSGVCACMCMCVQAHVCVYVCVCKCMCVHVFVCACVLCVGALCLVGGNLVKWYGISLLFYYFFF